MSVKIEAKEMIAKINAKCNTVAIKSQDGIFGQAMSANSLCMNKPSFGGLDINVSELHKIFENILA